MYILYLHFTIQFICMYTLYYIHNINVIIETLKIKFDTNVYVQRVCKNYTNIYKAKIILCTKTK